MLWRKGGSCLCENESIHKSKAITLIKLILWGGCACHPMILRAKVWIVRNQLEQFNCRDLNGESETQTCLHMQNFRAIIVQLKCSLVQLHKLINGYRSDAQFRTSQNVSKITQLTPTLMSTANAFVNFDTSTKILHPGQHSGPCTKFQIKQGFHLITDFIKMRSFCINIAHYRLLILPENAL